MKRKICFITGTRADYGIISSVMREIQLHPSLQLFIVATSMHLMREFGNTYKEIENDGFYIYRKINISYKEDSGMAMAISIGEAVSKISRVLSHLKPDFIVVLGDRGEMLAAAIA